MTKRISKFEDWLTASKAASLLSDKMGFSVSPKYIRQMAKRKKQPVRTQSLGYHQLYSKADIERSTIKQRKPGHP